MEFPFSIMVRKGKGGLILRSIQAHGFESYIFRHHSKTKQNTIVLGIMQRMLRKFLGK